MILSEEDVTRLVAQGYRKQDFCFQDTEGFIRLKNNNGRCVFLQNN
jgi:hypothetical protein